MGPFFLSIAICFILSSSSHQLLCAGRDRLMAGESILVNQTIISAGGTFALGFFTPGNSTTNRYVGIWYNSIPGKTVVWVANRENPLTDSAGALTVKEDGNIAVLDAKGAILWSTNVPGIPRNTTAVLLDSGNLVLREGDDVDSPFWQSFDHPTDTLLPNMKLRWSYSTGASQNFVAWKHADDPSPGKFSFGIDPNSPLQLYIKKDSEVYWRGVVWSGAVSVPIRLPNTSSSYTQSTVVNDQEINWSITATEGLPPARCVLNATGRFSFFIWDGKARAWILARSRPSEPCEFYNRCGPSGSCDSTGDEHVCRCLNGFVPRSQQDWDVGNFTGGCVRRMPVKCGEGDKFSKFSHVRLPDKFRFVRNKSEKQCEAECFRNCKCSAYAYSNFRTENIMRCLIWVEELMDLGKVTVSSFLSEDLYVRLVASEPDNNDQIDGSSGKGKDMLKIILPTLVGVLLMVTFCYFLKVRKRKISKAVLLENMKFSETLETEKDITEIPLLDFSTVIAATDNFSTANKLGEGGFGPVYKGKLLQGHEIAVKRLSKRSGQGLQEFANEVKLIAKLQHMNLVRLLGWCSHEDEKILIYEYMPNKSLDKFIFDPTRSIELNWKKRFRIIEGIANGLLYLHKHSRLRVIHRDLKSSNILLDGAMNPKISDFGLARIFRENQIEANTNKVAGTYGYMSPEYALNGLFSEKSDVFSFGVIVLEIVTGKRSSGFYLYEESLNLLGYAWQLWGEGRSLETIDPSIGDSFRATELVKCFQLGLLCIQENAADRPTMTSVVSILSNENATLPSPKQPAFTTGRHANPSAADSINGLTMSDVESR